MPKSKYPEADKLSAHVERYRAVMGFFSEHNGTHALCAFRGAQRDELSTAQIKQVVLKWLGIDPRKYDKEILKMLKDLEK